MEWYQIVDKARSIIDEFDKKLNEEKKERPNDKTTHLVNCEVPLGIPIIIGKKDGRYGFVALDDCNECSKDREKLADKFKIHFHRAPSATELADLAIDEFIKLMDGYPKKYLSSVSGLQYRRELKAKLEDWR